MVANPRTIKDFARANQQRSKTDRLDAATILEFARRMPFTPWSPPAPEVLELRSIARRVASLVVERTRERNRLKALQASGTASRVVTNDLLVNINHLNRRTRLY